MILEFKKQVKKQNIKTKEFYILNKIEYLLRYGYSLAISYNEQEEIIKGQFSMMEIDTNILDTEDIKIDTLLTFKSNFRNCLLNNNGSVGFIYFDNKLKKYVANILVPIIDIEQGNVKGYREMFDKNASSYTFIDCLKIVEKYLKPKKENKMLSLFPKVED